MTPEERAAAVVRAAESEDSRRRLETLIAVAIREAWEAGRDHALATDRARFDANAMLPATWEHDTIEAAKEEEREACAALLDAEAAKADEMITGLLAEPVQQKGDSWQSALDYWTTWRDAAREFAARIRGR